MATAAIPQLPCVVGGGPAQEANHEESSRLTLAHLLHPERWDLPGRDEQCMSASEDIADKFEILDHSLTLLKRYRNSLRPVHRLSPDVLALIFLEVASEDCHPLSSEFGTFSWSFVAHICYRWRVIALGCAALWTQLSTRYPQAAMTCLERSGDAPLSLVLHARAGHEAMDLIDSIRPHMNRMRHLYVPWIHVSDEDGVMSPLLSPLLEAPAPQLETFYVYRYRADGTCFELPIVFGGNTPRLRILKLSYCYPRLGCATFSNLRELYFRGRKRNNITLELASVLEILAECPLLEILVTIKARFVADEPLEREDAPIRRIRLDSLRRLEVSRCSASVVATFLSRLIIPHCHLSMSVWLERGSDFRFLFGVPDDLCAEHPLRDIRKLQVAFCSSSSGVVLDGSTSAHPFQIAAIIGQSAIGDMPTISGPLLLSIAKTLDLSLLEEFTIAETAHYHPHVGFSRDLWTQVLARMPLLRALHIRLQNITDSGFCRVVLSALGTADSVTGRLPCSQLETITLSEDRTWSSLQWYRFARARKEHGCPLRRLSLSLPHYENVEDMAETDLEELREVVENVDLDPPQTPQAEFQSLTW
ncbi:hypothetical protein C8Q77DRAFT_1154627 [Trametes polyzona]|nr:hypothetical protein C8Q77DRAFT_1154627 [Trametes polyzona]